MQVAMCGVKVTESGQALALSRWPLTIHHHHHHGCHHTPNQAVQPMLLHRTRGHDLASARSQRPARPVPLSTTASCRRCAAAAPPNLAPSHPLVLAIPLALLTHLRPVMVHMSSACPLQSTWAHWRGPRGLCGRLCHRPPPCATTGQPELLRASVVA